MVYDDPLSQLSLKKDPNWPKYLLTRGYHGHTEQEIEKELEKIDFNLEEWINYKLNVPNDGLSRKYSHPKVEYPLTKEEFIALKDDGAFLYNPGICPKQWEKHILGFGEVEKRYEWLSWQDSFLRNGFPKPPKIIWGCNRNLLRIYTELLYNPFIEYWGEPPDDFWVKLSYHLEGENEELVHLGFILVFESKGRIFPSPSLYNPEKDPNPEELLLPDDYWIPL